MRSTLVELGEAEGDAAIVKRGEGRASKALKPKAQRRQIETLLSGEADGNDTYVEIHSGAGGTESQDWARMLLRMYTRWAERRELQGRADRRDATAKRPASSRRRILIKGHNAYGWLKTESGVHRLVRISPFDSNARRHTSFASVWVYPVVDDRINIEINESRLPHRHLSLVRRRRPARQHDRIRRCASPICRPASSSPARRSARSTRTAPPRGTCCGPGSTSGSSKKREAEANADAASKTEIGWGHQIRSYVLQPYQLVKDLRTGVTSGTPGDVLDGDLDGFMEAALAQRV